jgi:hypothetical protein
MRSSFTVLRSIYLIQSLSCHYVGATNISLTLQTSSFPTSNRQPLLATIVIDVDVVVETQSISVSHYNTVEPKKTRSPNNVVSQTGISTDTSFNPWVTPLGSLLPAGRPHYIPLTATPYRTNQSLPSNLSSGSTLWARPTTSMSAFRGHDATLLAISRYFLAGLTVLVVFVQYAEHM